MEEQIKQNLMRHAYNGTACLDPRCKLFLLIAVGIISFLLTGGLSGFLLILSVGVVLAFGSARGSAFKGILGFIMVSLLNTLLRYVRVPFLSILMGVFGVTVLKMIPIFLLASWVLRTTPMDDLIVALQRLKLPQSVIVPLIVVFRYIPTLKIEYRTIRGTMEIRGICDTRWHRLLHPIKTVEYILIPLLMRCLKVTDELTASGATRGIENTGKRYALHLVHFGTAEWLCSLAGISVLLLLLCLDQTGIGQLSLWRVML